MDERNHPAPSSAARLDAKRAFFARHDAHLAAAGYAVPAPPPPAPPPPAPPPPVPAPALSFEAWAELSVGFTAASPGDVTAALAARGLTLEVWQRLDGAYRRALSDDLRAGRQELSALYKTKHEEALARRTGEPAAPAASAGETPPALPTVQLAPEALRGTAGLPDLPPAILASMGRTPFMPPPPQAPAHGKPPAKTVPSKVVPSRVGGLTMPLDATMERPTPAVPFVGSSGSQAVGYVPPLDARQYVALSVELALQPAPREETLSRYRVPTEAALRALDEQWQHPARRAELEHALASFAVMLRCRVLR